MTGNLVDNACKWAAQKVFIEVLLEMTPGGALDPTLRIIVDDDGPGLSPAQRTQVAVRGQRLDETKPGSGLGPVHRDRSGGALRRQPQARRRADRGAAGGAGIAGGVRIGWQESRSNQHVMKQQVLFCALVWLTKA